MTTPSTPGICQASTFKLPVEVKHSVYENVTIGSLKELIVKAPVVGILYSD